NASGLLLRAANDRPPMNKSPNKTKPNIPNSDPTCSGSECTAARLGSLEASSEEGVNEPGPAPKKGAVAQRLSASDQSVCRALLKLSPDANQAGHEARLPRNTTTRTAATATVVPI